MQGFELPARKGIADFLQEVTSHKDQEQYWARTTQPYEFVPVEAFARAFKGTDVGQRNARHLEQPHERPPDQLSDPLVRKKCALLLAHLDLYIRMLGRNMSVLMEFAVCIWMSAYLMAVYMSSTCRS